MKKTIIPVLVLLLATACQKENAAKSKTTLLTQASWKFSSAVAAGTDVSNNAAITCIKDDIISFSANGTGTITEGTILCSPTTAGSFTWSLLNAETQLQMSSGIYPSGNGLFTITAISETSLTITQDVTIPPAVTPVPVAATYIH